MFGRSHSISCIKYQIIQADNYHSTDYMNPRQIFTLHIMNKHVYPQ
uniref:Uncharacterized protein n=1 Tax=Rhizophora mucronata TaxID=61149 RepID=A0A2P2PPL5_RHIMU